MDKHSYYHFAGIECTWGNYNKRPQIRHFQNIEISEYGISKRFYKEFNTELISARRMLIDFMEKQRVVRPFGLKLDCKIYLWKKN